MTYRVLGLRLSSPPPPPPIPFRYGMHESYNYYQDCKLRNRNLGLFTADRVRLTIHMHARAMRTNMYVRKGAMVRTLIWWAGDDRV